MSFIKKIKSHLEIIEAGGVDDYIINSPIYYYDDEEDEDEDLDNLKDKIEMEENIFDKRVEDGKIITTKREPGEDLFEPISDLKNNANLIKARIKARTPKSNLKRKKSMRVRKRDVDRDR
jgi:hypothetical protein